MSVTMTINGCHRTSASSMLMFLDRFTRIPHSVHSAGNATDLN